MEKRFDLMKYVILWVRMYYGFHLLVSGLRYLALQKVPPVPHPVGGPFIAALDHTGIYHMVKIIETGVGVCLLLNFLVPLVLVVEVPISIVIFILNFFIVASGRQLFSGPFEIILNVTLLVFYAGYYRPMLTWNPKPAPLWTWWRKTA